MGNLKYIEIELDKLEAHVTSLKIKDGDTKDYLSIIDESKLTKHIKKKNRCQKNVIYIEPQPEKDTFYILYLEPVLDEKQVITVDYQGNLVKKGNV